MQTRNPLIDDLTKMASGAMGALTGVKDEVEARIRDQIAKILDGMDIPRRDEFDAVKAMAAKARSENAALNKRLVAMEEVIQSLNAKSKPKAAAAAKPKAAAKAKAKPAAKPKTVRKTAKK